MPSEGRQVYRVPLAAEVLADSKLEAYSLVAAALEAANVLRIGAELPAQLVLGPFHLTEGWKDAPAEPEQPAGDG